MKKEGRRVDVEHDTDVGFKDNGVVTSDGGEVTMVVLLLLSLLFSSTCDKKKTNNGCCKCYRITTPVAFRLSRSSSSPPSPSVPPRDYKASVLTVLSPSKSLCHLQSFGVSTVRRQYGFNT